jgi:PmbA protein
LSDLLSLAEETVRQAMAQGATDAECTVKAGEEFSVSVRMHEIEQLKEAGSRAMGLRVFVGQRNGSATTSDLTSEGVARMIRAALDNAKVTTDDPLAGLPEEGAFGSHKGDLRLFSDDISELPAPWKIEQAIIAERSALEADPRICNSEGGSFDSYLSERYFANSRGFRGEYRTSSVAMSAMPVAEADGKKERDYAYSIARSLDRLKDASSVGREAAERTVRRLGARKIPTQKAPVLFESRVARGLVGHIFEAVSGDSIYRKASFLLDKLGEKVASDKLTIVDDPTIPGLFGSWPFDDEGLPARRKVVIERGVLNTYLHNSYTARKCGAKSTGNAGRGLAGNPWVEHGNFFVEPGEAPPEKLIAGIQRGLLVTELMGQGVNVVNGDYSRGAAGLWIENGEIAYPVSEITIAGNLRDMLFGIQEVGADLEFQGSTASPALLLEEMTISGS